MLIKLDPFPKVGGENKRNIWHHHLADFLSFHGKILLATQKSASSGSSKSCRSSAAANLAIRGFWDLQTNKGPKKGTGHKFEIYTI